jgi:hypothetical protein
MQHVFTTS